MKVEFSDTALHEIDGIRRWIARHDRERAISFVRELRASADGLSTMPLRFPLLDDSQLPGVRRLNHRGYRILFTVEAERVLVLHVHHGARDRPGPAA